jgi:hypothetical protein
MKTKSARRPLDGQVAVVAGATRGAGRGIARMLGEAGAVVYCTGRSARGGPPPSGVYAGRTETIDETAEMVSAHGGVGIPVRVERRTRRVIEKSGGLYSSLRLARGENRGSLDRWPTSGGPIEEVTIHHEASKIHEAPKSSWTEFLYKNFFVSSRFFVAS